MTGTRPVKIALIQMGARARKEDSLRTAEAYLRRASEAGAEIAMLPEMFNCPYQASNFPVYAEAEGGPCWQRMSEAAAAAHLYLIAGSMPERD